MQKHSSFGTKSSIPTEPKIIWRECIHSYYGMLGTILWGSILISILWLWLADKHHRPDKACTLSWRTVQKPCKHFNIWRTSKTSMDKLPRTSRTVLGMRYKQRVWIYKILSIVITAKCWSVDVGRGPTIINLAGSWLIFQEMVPWWGLQSWFLLLAKGPPCNGCEEDQPGWAETHRLLTVVKLPSRASWHLLMNPWMHCVMTGSGWGRQLGWR